MTVALTVDVTELCDQLKFKLQSRRDRKLVTGEKETHLEGYSHMSRSVKYIFCHV